MARIDRVGANRPSRGAGTRPRVDGSLGVLAACMIGVAAYSKRSMQMDRLTVRITRFVASVAAVAFGFGLGLPTEAVASTILFDNTNALAATINSPGSSSSLATAHRGVTFTVGANAITLNQATFGMYGNVAGETFVGLRLYTGSIASGTADETLSAISVNLATIGDGGTKVTFNTSGWTLDANTQYTVAATFAQSGTTARLGISNLNSGSWTSSGLTFDRFTADSGAASDNYYVALSGTIAGAVPGAGLAGLATVGLAGVSRRRRR